MTGKWNGSPLFILCSDARVHTPLKLLCTWPQDVTGPSQEGCQLRNPYNWLCFNNDVKNDKAMTKISYEYSSLFINTIIIINIYFLLFFRGVGVVNLRR